MIPTSWIYSLKRDELIEYLEEFSIDSSGNVEELRRRPSQFVSRPDERYIERLTKLAEFHKFVSPTRNGNGTLQGNTATGPEGAASSPSDPAVNTLSEHNTTADINDPSQNFAGAINSTITTSDSTTGAIRRPDPPNNEWTANVTATNITNTTRPLSSYELRVPTLTTSVTSLRTTTTTVHAHTPSTCTYGHITNMLPQAHFVTPPLETSTTFRPTDLTTLMDKIRKWSLRYSGGNGALAFIERIEEMAEAYGIDIHLMPRTLTEILQGQALIWYRCNKKPWRSWQEFREEFLEFFLPPGYFDHLEDTVRERKQGPKELFKNYVIGIQDLMHHVEYTDNQKLDRIYKNNRREYQLNIKRREFNTLAELLLLAGDFEAKMNFDNHHAFSNSQNTRAPPERGRQTIATEPDAGPIDTRRACWNCGQIGHSKPQCRNPQILFCWECGKRDVRTIQCCRQKQGNANGAPTQGQGSTRM